MYSVPQIQPQVAKMESTDPATGQPLPPDAIQRVLFIVSTVHVYNIPPMTPGKGHVAASVSLRLRLILLLLSRFFGF